MSIIPHLPYTFFYAFWHIEGDSLSVYTEGFLTDLFLPVFL